MVPECELRRNGNNGDRRFPGHPGRNPIAYPIQAHGVRLTYQYPAPATTITFLILIPKQFENLQPMLMFGSHAAQW